MDMVHLCEGFGGGAARHVIDLATAQAEHGHRVRVIYCPSQVDLQATTLMLASPKVTWHSVPMQKKVNLRDVLIIARILRVIIEGGRPQLIHCHCNKAGLMGVVIAPFLRVPFVYTPHAFFSMQPRLSGISLAFSLAVERALSRLATTTLLLSRKEANFAAKHGFNGGRFRISANGITPAALAVMDRLRPASETLVIGFLGRLSYQKGTDTLLSAIRAAKGGGFRVEVHGFGPEEPLVQAAVRDYPERISFHGPANGPGVMARFDILVMTSRYEGFPYVLLEALAQGLPIITTDVGGVDEMVADKWNGVILRGEPVAALIEVINHLDDYDWPLMGSHSRLLSQRHTAEGMFRRIMDAYREFWPSNCPRIKNEGAWRGS